MTTKTVYLFDPITVAYTGTYEAEQSPLEPEQRDKRGRVIKEAVYIAPQCSTPKMPPAAGKNQIPVFSVELDAWALSPDFRGVTVYEATTGAEASVTEIGPLPPNLIEALTLEMQLAKARQEANLRLGTDCMMAIVGGFASAARGALLKYPSNPTDQANLASVVAESNSPTLPAGWTRKLWCADDLGVWSMLDHDAIQVRQVLADFTSHREACSATLIARLDKVSAAKTVAAIAKVIW